jgi:hypothetical protein
MFEVPTNDPRIFVQTSLFWMHFNVVEGWCNTCGLRCCDVLKSYDMYMLIILYICKLVELGMFLEV